MSEATSAAGALVVTKGLWWKSLLLSWVLAQPIGWAVVSAGGLRPPDYVGVLVWAALWAGTWWLWRARRHGAAPMRTPLQTMQLLTVAFLGAVVAIGYAVVILETEAELPSVGVAVEPVAAGLLAIGVTTAAVNLLSLPRLRLNGTVAQGVGLYRARFFMRVALAEAPALAGFVAVLVAGRTWLYAIGLAASVVGFAALLPTPRRVRRDQARAHGHLEADLAAVLGGVADEATGQE